MEILYKYSKSELIQYLLAEIDELEPKDIYYSKYYHDFVEPKLSSEMMNFEVTNEEYKKLFIEELNKSSEAYLIEFMIRNMFLYESVDESDRTISKILNETKNSCNTYQDGTIDKENTLSTENTLNQENFQKNQNLIYDTCIVS